MAFLDASLFLTAAAGDSLAISSSTAGSVVYDVTGAGSGNAPPQSFGKASAFGADMGIGDGVAQPFLEVAITTTLLTSTSATLQVALQSAPDNGSNAPGSWTTVVETDAITAANLVAGTKIALPISKRAPARPCRASTGSCSSSLDRRASPPARRSPI